MGANSAAALDARRKLREIAARDLGGSLSDCEIGGERVYRRDNRLRGLSFATAAQRAIDLGGRRSSSLGVAGCEAVL